MSEQPLIAKERVIRKQIVCFIGAGFLVLWMVACSQGKKTVVEGAARDWLRLVDSGNYAQSWDEAATVLKATIAKEKWQQILTENRAPLGTLLSRKLKSAEYTAEFHGAPPGRYVVLKYESSFEHKSSAIETVIPTSDKDGKWRVSLYVIK